MLLVHRFWLAFFCVSLLLLGNASLVQSQESTASAVKLNRDSGLPADFELEKLRVRLDSPDRFGMRHLGKDPSQVLLGPVVTPENGPIWVSGKVNLIGRWKEWARIRKEQPARNESDVDFLMLDFRAIRLVGAADAFAAIKRQDFELFRIQEDPASGERKMVWEIDPEIAQNEDNEAGVERENKKRTGWRKKTADEVSELKLQIELPRNNEEVELEVPFGFTWYPDKVWQSHSFYAIDVASGEFPEEVELTRTALFQTSVPVREPERELRVAVYTALTSFGIPLDPFWWLK